MILQVHVTLHLLHYIFKNLISVVLFDILKIRNLQVTQSVCKKCCISGEWVYPGCLPNTWHASPVLPRGTPAETSPADEQDHDPPRERQCATPTHAGVEGPGTGLLEVDGQTFWYTCTH